TRLVSDWSSDVCSSDLAAIAKQNAHRRGRGKALSLFGECTGFWVSREHADLARVLICHQHPALRGIQHKVARSFSAAGGVAGRCQAARLCVGTEMIERAIAAIGKVHILAVF